MPASPSLTPAERAALCAQCKLARCNEQSPSCLIKIKRLETAVNRVGGSVLAQHHDERARTRTVNGAILELLTTKKLRPETFAAMVEPYRGE